MTPQLQAAIAAIEPLNAIERQHRLHILLHSDPSTPEDSSNLTIQSQQFWNGISLQQLQTTQNPAIYHPAQNSSDFWPETETIENFLVFLDQQRHETI